MLHKLQSDSPISICSTASSTVTFGAETVFTNGYRLHTTTLQRGRKRMTLEKRNFTPSQTCKFHSIIHITAHLNLAHYLFFKEPIIQIPDLSSLLFTTFLSQRDFILFFTPPCPTRSHDQKIDAVSCNQLNTHNVDMLDKLGDLQDLRRLVLLLLWSTR